jgi:hypothetical protein
MLKLFAHRGAKASKFRDYNRALVLKHPRTLQSKLPIPSGVSPELANDAPRRELVCKRIM